MTDRVFSEVLDQILEVVPNDSLKLQNRLIAIQISSLFAAPEMQYAFWRIAADILEEEIGVPTMAWELKVSNIFVGKEL